MSYCWRKYLAKSQPGNWADWRSNLDPSLHIENSIAEVFKNWFVCLVLIVTVSGVNLHWITPAVSIICIFYTTLVSIRKYFTHVCWHRWSRPLQLMKATVLTKKLCFHPLSLWSIQSSDVQRHESGLSFLQSNLFFIILPFQVYLLYLACISVTWCHNYCVCTNVYSLLIDKDLCDSQNITIKFLCALLSICALHPETSSFFSKFP